MPPMPATDADERAVRTEYVTVPPPRRGRGWIAFFAVILLAFGGIVAVRGWDILNPFQEQSTVRSGPVLIQSIRDMKRYVAAQGEFQVIIDQQQGRENIPDFLYGERTVLVAVGNVDAYVDFSQITEGALTVDGTTVRLALPAPSLAPPALDTERSYLVAHDEGVANRIAGIFGSGDSDQMTLYHQAEQKIGEAAQASDLRARAEANATTMLTSLFRQLGYSDVGISFADQPAR
jgi:Protein of unknown function (DUF4230)